MNKQIEGFLVFLKAQLSAFLGSIVDYALMIFITEDFKIHYTISIIISGLAGAVVNFFLNRKWTFRTEGNIYQSPVRGQISKFLFVVINSITLKSAGTFLITTFLHINYKFSRIIVDLFVSLVFNYNLQKYWVFKKKKVNTI